MQFKFHVNYIQGSFLNTDKPLKKYSITSVEIKRIEYIISMSICTNKIVSSFSLTSDVKMMYNFRVPNIIRIADIFKSISKIRCD